MERGRAVFTYNENRVLLVERGTLSFPNKVSIAMEFSPNPVLGDQVPGLTCAVGSNARLTWDANTGRSLAESDPPLPTTKTVANVDGVNVRINGRSLRATFHCASRGQLLGVLGALHFVAPVSLGLEFADPFTTAVTSGRVGNTKFVWQVERTSVNTEAVHGSERNSRCAQAIERLPVLCDPRNRRLLAAITYFQRAIRLLSAGVGPTEFAGEAVVNLAKTLEVLFPGPQSRDAVRRGLERVGYEKNFIEQKFIPALLLRSHLDAAHVRMATLKADERRKLQTYVEAVAVDFRALIARSIQAVADGELQLTPYQDERKPGDDISKILDGIGEP
jgi:hypothetical protein